MFSQTSASNRRHQLLMIFLFYAFIAAGLMAPIASDTNIPNLADYINHVMMVMQAKIALAQGQFPLRVAPLEQSTWGYPYYQFYAPTVYTIAGEIYRWLTPSNPLMAVKITIWASMVCAGVFMTRLAYWFTKSLPAAMLGGVAYLAAPYFVMIVDQLGSLAEIMAMGMVPAVIYYTLQRYYYPNSNKTLVQTSFAWYLLLTMHLPTFFYTGLFTGILLLIVTINSRRHWHHLFRVGIAIAFASMLAMWFLAPIATLTKFLMINVTVNSAEYFVQFKPLLSNLLFPSAIFTSGSNSALITFHPSVGWPIMLAVGVCLYAYLAREKVGVIRTQFWLVPLLIIFMMAFIMVWSPVNFWKLLPAPFLVGQRCWRLLSQVIWIGALLFSFAMCYLFKNKLDLRHLIIGSLLIVVSVASWFTEVKTMDPASLYKNPHLIYNDNSYVVNFEKYPAMVMAIDNVLIDPAHKLKVNSSYPLAKSLLNLAIEPTILLQAHVPATVDKQPLQLSALINDKLIDTKHFAAGNFNWVIPVQNVKQLISAQRVPALKFNSNNPATKMTVDRIILSGFIQPSEKLDVDAIKNNCYAHKDSTICKINVPASVKLVELPMLYYPNMLRIMLNGKQVSYQSILFNGYLMTSIVPEAGALNTIKIKFTGLVWANWVSIAAWIGWGLLLIEVLVRARKPE